VSSDHVFVHPSAHVDDRAEIGAGSQIWVNAQIREGAKLGFSCVISKDVYVDHDVVIGDRCKVQNGVSIYHGVTLGDDVFVGPGVVFTNDRVPRAFRDDWTVVPTEVRRGASLGANCTILCGLTIGEYAMVAAGSVVTHDVPDHTLVVGSPARPVATIDRQGNRLAD
jgi:acetyltransferase-like isoleucine patch superfamily enzyme